MLRNFILFIVCTASVGCAGIGYAGTAKSIQPDVWKHESGWIAVNDVPLHRQVAEHDCGPKALAMVLGHYRAVTPEDIYATMPANQRITAGVLRDRARELGFSSFVIKGTLQDIKHELTAGRPVIVGVAKQVVTGSTVAHYEVVVGLHQASQRIATLDPAEGWRQNSLTGFLHEWLPTDFVMIVVLPPKKAAEAEAPAAISSNDQPRDPS